MDQIHNDKAMLSLMMPPESVEQAPRVSRCGTLRRVFGYILFGSLAVLSLIGLSKEYESLIQQRRVQTSPANGSWTQGLEAFMSPDTVRTLESDTRLRQSLLTMVEMTADLSQLLSSRIDSPALKEASQILQEYQAEMSQELQGQQHGRELESPAVRRRQLFGGGGNMDNVMGGALGGALMNGINNIGSQLLGDLNGSGMFLGIGVGTGAAQGLNISTPEQTQQVAQKVAADNQQQPTGLNPLLQNVGIGLTGSILGNLDTNSLLGGLQGQLQPIAMALAQGLGNGTVVGLNINPASAPRPVNDSSIENVIGTFGFGLTQSVTGNIDTQALLGQLNNPENTASIMRNLPDIATGLGKGLGEGVAVGLGLQPDAPVPMRQMPDGSVDVGGVTQTFTKSLAASLLQNGTAEQLVGMIGGSMANAPAPPGGGGIPSTIEIGGQNVEIARVAQGFASGLLQGAGDTIQGMGGVEALIGGTATMPMSGMPVVRSSFDDGVGGAATGLGAGLGGGGVLLASMLIANPSGTPAVPQPPPAVAPPAAPVPEIPQAPPIPGETPVAPTPGSPEVAPVAPVEGQPAARRRGLGLVPRQNPVIDVDTNQGFNLSVIINAETVSMALQAALDALTCQGFGGGLGNVLLGLISTKTIPLDALSNMEMGNTMDVIQQVIPTGTLELRNEGNVYRIGGQQLRDSVGQNIDINAAVGAIEVNGMGLGAFIAFAVIHIVFALVAFINVLPLALGFESLRNILLRAKLTQVLPKIPKWTHIMWLFVIPPSILIVFVFGVVMYGNSAHFRSAHGIISLITTIVGLAAVALHFVVRAGAAKIASGAVPPPPPSPFSLPNIRIGVNQLFLLLAVLSTMTGFKDLSSVALCFTQVVPFDIALSIGFGLSTVFVLGSTIMGLDIFIMFRDARKKKESMREKGQAVEEAVEAEDNLEQPDNRPNVI